MGSGCGLRPELALVVFKKTGIARVALRKTTPRLHHPLWQSYVDKHVVYKTSSGLFGQVNFQLYTDRENDEKSLYFSTGLNMDGKRNLK